MAWYDSLNWKNWKQESTSGNPEMGNLLAKEGIGNAGTVGGGRLSGGTGQTWMSTASDYLGKAQKRLSAYEGQQPQPQQVTPPEQQPMPSGGLQYPDVEQFLTETQEDMTGRGDLMEEIRKMIEQGGGTMSPQLDYRTLSASRKKLYEMAGNYYNR